MMSGPREFERRITAALERLGAGVERLQRAAQGAVEEAARMRDAAPGADGDAEAGHAAAEPAREGAEARAVPQMVEEALAEAAAAHAAEIAALKAALEAEREAHAQAGERIRAMREKQESVVPELERRLEALTRQIDAQAVETQRLKMTNVELRETLRALREAAEQGLADPALVNRALAAELDALRASRAADIAELDSILGQLHPLIAEISHA